MQQITINGKEITSWKAFHNFFAKTFGFPDFYGKNMNAWIDCMGDLDCPEYGMTTKISLRKGESLELLVYHAKVLRKENYDIYDALISGTSAVNRRKEEDGETPIIYLTFKD